MQVSKHFLFLWIFMSNFQTQELMVPFRLACFATKYKEDLFPINNGHSKPFQSSNKLIKWSLTLELSDSSNWQSFTYSWCTKSWLREVNLYCFYEPFDPYLITYCPIFSPSPTDFSYQEYFLDEHNLFYMSIFNTS